MKLCRSVVIVALCLTAVAAAHGYRLAVLSPLEADIPMTARPSPQDALAENALLPDSPVPVESPNRQSSSVPLVLHTESQQAHARWRPLTGQQRLILFWNDTYASPGAFVALSGGALIAQATNTPAQWTKDGNGYTRRFTSGYGQLATRNVVHDGLAGVTGLDPRYIPCGCQGAFRRSFHAVRMTVSTYTRAGRPTLDVPQIAAAYGSGMVSTYWYPHQSYSPLVQGVQFGHLEMGEVFINNLFQEFGADLKHALHPRSSKAQTLQLGRTSF